MSLAAAGASNFLGQRPVAIAERIEGVEPEMLLRSLEVVVALRKLFCWHDHGAGQGAGKQLIFSRGVS